jgi:lysophospholipase L1-like esterase
MNRWAALARWTVLGSIAVVVLAAIVEGAVVLLFGVQERWPTRLIESPIGLRLMEPGSRFRQQTAAGAVEIRVNGQGMRADRDYAPAKPAGVRRILAIGDSTTVGFGVEVEQTFVQVLEDRLKAAGLPVEVLNAGVPGFGTSEELFHLEQELLARYSPDLVLVSFYENDIKDNVRTPLYRWENDRLVRGAERYFPDARVTNLLRTQPLLRWLDEHSNAFAFARSQGAALLRRRRTQAGAQATDAAAAAVAPEKFTRTDPPRRMTAALFDAFLERTRARGIPLVIQSIPSPAWPEGRLVLQEVFPVEFFDAGRAGVSLVLGMDWLPQRIGELDLYQRTNHHFAPGGHRVMGEVLAQHILERGLLTGPPKTDAATAEGLP